MFQNLQPFYFNPLQVLPQLHTQLLLPLQIFPELPIDHLVQVISLLRFPLEIPHKLNLVNQLGTNLGVFLVDFVQLYQGIIEALYESQFARF